MIFLCKSTYVGLHIDVGALHNAIPNKCKVIPFSCSYQLRCCLHQRAREKEHKVKEARDSLPGSGRFTERVAKFTAFATSSATVTTARTHACASGDEQCATICGGSVRGIVVRNSKISPAQSSGNSAKGLIEAAV